MPAEKNGNGKKKNGNALISKTADPILDASLLFPCCRVLMNDDDGECEERMPTLSRLGGKGNLGKEEKEKGITSEKPCCALHSVLLCFASLCKKDFAVCKPCFAPGLLDVVARRGSLLCQRHAGYD